VSHPARAGARRLEVGVVSAVGAGALGQMEEAGALARSRRRSLWGPGGQGCVQVEGIRSVAA